MKLFQIEEPDGSPLEPEGPGMAGGIGAWPARGAGGAGGAGGRAPAAVGALMLAVRERAEKALARPVTHAVVASDALDDAARRALEAAAQAAGIALLRVVAADAAAALAPGAKTADAPALGAAIQAEQDATGLAR